MASQSVDDETPPAIPPRARTPSTPVLTPVRERTPTPTPLREQSSTPTPPSSQQTDECFSTPRSTTGSIRRKPLPFSHYDSSQTLRDACLTDETAPSSAPRGNPLEKTIIQMTPDRVATKDFSAASASSDEPRTRVILPGKTKGSVRGIHGWSLDGFKDVEWKKLSTWDAKKLKNTDWKSLWENFVQNWSLDLVWFAISLGCLIIIWAVLGSFNGTPLNELPMSITPNTFLAFFLTIAKAALLVPLTECISQWKWDYFHRADRPLSDFQTFDAASRSPWGSVLLLAKLKHRHIVSLGAGLFVLMLLADPITQLSIQYPHRFVPSATGQASVLRATLIPALGEESGAVPSEYRNAIMNGLLAPWDDPLDSAPAVCSSPACSFPRFDSISVCAKIHDISNLLKISSSNDAEKQGNRTESSNSTTSARSSSYEVSLSQDTDCKMAAQSPYNVLTCKTPGSTTLSFNDDEGLKRSAFYSMPILYSTPGVKDNNRTAVPDFHALEVLFHVCVNTYHVEVTEGKSTTKQLNSSAIVLPQSTDRTVNVNCTTPTPDSDSNSLNCTSSPASSVPSDAFIVLDGSGDQDGPAQTFRAHVGTLERMALALNRESGGYWASEGIGAADFERSDKLGASEMPAISRAIYTGEGQDIGDRTERVRKMMDNVAISLTNVIRAHQPRSPDDDTTGNAVEVTGTALVTQTFIKINWSAFTLIILQFLLALAFLLATAILTPKNTEGLALKGSALATLFALDEECRGVVGGVESPAAMRRKARVLQIRLRGGVLGLSGDGVGDEEDNVRGEKVHEENVKERVEEEDLKEESDEEGDHAGEEERRKEEST